MLLTVKRHLFNEAPDEIRWIGRGGEACQWIVRVTGCVDVSCEEAAGVMLLWHGQTPRSLRLCPQHYRQQHRAAWMPSVEEIAGLGVWHKKDAQVVVEE